MDIAKLVRQCMYCRNTEYTSERNIDISHGVCRNPLCVMEYALDYAVDEEDFEHYVKMFSGDDNEP